MKNKLLLSVAMCFLVTPIVAMAGGKGTSFTDISTEGKVDSSFSLSSSTSSLSLSSSSEPAHIDNTLSGSLEEKERGMNGEDPSARIRDLERKLALSEKALQDANAYKERLEQAYTEDRLRTLAFAAAINQNFLTSQAMSSNEGKSPLVRNIAAFTLAGLCYNHSPETLAEWGIHLPDSIPGTEDMFRRTIESTFQVQRRAMKAAQEGAPSNLQTSQRPLPGSSSRNRVAMTPVLPHIDYSPVVRRNILSSTLFPITPSLSSSMADIEDKRGKGVPANKSTEVDEGVLEELHESNIRANRLALGLIPLANHEDKGGKEDKEGKNVLSLLSIPDVLLARIISYGTPDSLVYLAEVCKGFAEKTLTSKIPAAIQLRHEIFSLRVTKGAPKNPTLDDIAALVRFHPEMQILDLSCIATPLASSESLYSRGRFIDVSALADLRELRILDLSYAPVTGLSNLRSMPGLQTLYLKETISKNTPVIPTHRVEWGTISLIRDMSMIQGQGLGGASFEIITDVTFRKHVKYKRVKNEFGLLPLVLNQIIKDYVNVPV